MSDKREQFVQRLLDICRTLSEHSEGRVRLAHAEGDECQDPEMEAAHFLKLDDKRIGRDIELLGFMTQVAGFEVAMADFAQVIVLIKANGVEGGYGAVREACSNLEEFMDDEGDKARWREIFSIPAKA